MTGGGHNNYGQLHEISRQVGNLEAQAAEGQRSREIMRQELRDTRHEVRSMAHNLNGVIELLKKVGPMCEEFPLIVSQVKEMAPIVDNYNQLRQRGIGILAGVGLAGTAGGAIGATWITPVKTFLSKLLTG